MITAHCSLITVHCSLFTVMNTIALNIPELDAEGFKQLCLANEDLQLERASTGEVIIMSPTYPWTGKKSSITALLWLWNDNTDLGISFDSSTGFTLPNGAVYSPDASWVSNEKWDGLTQQQREEEFSTLAPDFIVELRSSSDSLKKLQKKMAEYSGFRLSIIHSCGMDIPVRPILSNFICIAFN